MKKEYDFSKGKRGAIDPVPSGKTRITIRLDNDIIDWFRSKVETKGGGNYQTMINDSLKEFIGDRRKTLEETIRHIFREEISKMTPQVIFYHRSSEIAQSEHIRRDISYGHIQAIAATNVIMGESSFSFTPPIGLGR